MEEVIGVPFAMNANGMMYNKKVFKELGLSIPQSWKELISTA